MNDTTTLTPVQNPRGAQYTVTALGIEPNTPGCFGNSALKWRAKFSAPSVGEFALPFEHLHYAEECTAFVKRFGSLPLMNKDGKMLPVKHIDPVMIAHYERCTCGAPATGLMGFCADCGNDMQKCSY